MRFIFEQLRVGGDRNFGYLLGDREAGLGVVIDPSYTPEALVERAQVQGLRITHILNTHGHPGPVDLILQDGDRVPFGAFVLRTWHVPGHYHDHLAFLVEGQDAGFTGDLLFVGKVGGTQTEADGRTEWASLQRLLRDWPDRTTIWPGHDYGARPSSSMAWERQTNPFLICPDVGAFLRAKQEWTTYKASLGLR